MPTCPLAGDATADDAVTRVIKPTKINVRQRGTARGNVRVTHAAAVFEFKCDVYTTVTTYDSCARLILAEVIDSLVSRLGFRGRLGHKVAADTCWSGIEQRCVNRRAVSTTYGY